MLIIRAFAFGVFLSISSFASFAEDMILTQPRLEHDDDTRGRWSQELLKLVLEKTKDEFGSYSIQYAPSMSIARIVETLKTNRYTNFFDFIVYRDFHADIDDVEYIRFPIQLGLLGYRICFYPKVGGQYITHALQNGKIKELVHGQGTGWTDVLILRHNGYKVIEVDNYKSLFRMAAAHRYDFFCRGITELYDEHQQENKNRKLSVEQTFAFHYEMPVFFYSNKANRKLINRVKRGLLKSYEDGSLVELFLHFYGKRIAFARLWERKIIHLESPLNAGIDPSYKQYNYNPGGFPISLGDIQTGTESRH